MVKAVWIIVMASVLQVSAGTNLSYSQSVKMNIHLENVDLEQVIWTMKKQSEFNFLYSNEDVKGVNKLDIEMKDATAETILDYCLKGTDLTYEIVNKAIIIKRTEGDGSRINNGLPAQSEAEQKRELSGTVKDSKGLPLPGVSVVVKGTTIGIITDSDGNFRLLIPADAKTIVFSFIGMKTQEFPILGKTNLNVVLAEETVGVDEVVIVAYGTQKKVTVTGAVSSLVAKELKQSPSANFVGAMAGRLPGLITMQNSGQPGAEGINIYLRGVSTTNGQNPLILIDGVPRDNITTIDPNEVASVSILKDASSTAVFGVRGANGVILITTKRGTTETPQINVTAEYGLQDFTRRNFQGVDSWDFARLRNEALANNGLPPE
ncbi:MAG: carboxypeptidase-like regulatory domain-containing protein, partial [Prolixibacteraceae bacterium]|nr:carboxypeptidase-like regulatory domain-containing protein [Prolixibacteraceae bacterium]